MAKHNLFELFIIYVNGLCEGNECIAARFAEKTILGRTASYEDDTQLVS